MKIFTKLTKGILAGLFLAAPLLVSAQGGEKYQPKDSINVRDRHRFRQWSYEQNQSAYPAPRKDNWSIGLQGGSSWIAGDVRAVPGWAGGLNLRRSLGHTLSVRASVSGGFAQGQNWRPNGGFTKNLALNGSIDANADYTSASYPLVFYNFRSRYLAANADLVAQVNNINFYNKEPRVGLHFFGGIGFINYGTYINALDANNNIYNYSNVPVGVVLSDKADALNSLDNVMDNTFETAAEEHYYKPQLFDGTFVPSVSLGGGLSYKMSRRVDVMIEHRLTITNDDLMDGQRWEETNTLSASFDVLNFTSVGINFRLGKGNDSKWWTNPLDVSYSSIRTLKAMSGKETADTDGDGVVDSMDKEAGTPKGARVDSHGKALDSDGDGVQDFRDREPYSIAGAEVDRDGVALDGDSDGVPNLLDKEPGSAAGAQVDVRGVTIRSAPATTAVTVGMSLPMIHFALGSAEITNDSYEKLIEVAKAMKDNPDAKIRITGHTDVRNANNKNADLSKARAENVANFLNTRFGIDKSRMIVEFRGADQPLVTAPADRDPKNEPLHYLNRRVEFELVK